MLRHHGHDCGMSTDPTPEPKDALLAPPGPSTLGIGTPDLFHLAILLMENLNMLKCRVNAEKQAHRDEPNNKESVSEDEEEVDSPVSTLQLRSSSTLQQP